MRLALDIGGTFIKCACVTDNGDIVKSGKFPTDPVAGDLASHIVQGTRRFMDEWGEEISIVGAGMAGFVDGSRGIVYKSPNIPGVKNLELARELSEGLGIPAYIDNDATAAAWGEYLFGGHEGIRDMLVVTLGTGIGGGLVLDGRLHRGARGLAGEFGQMAFVPDGPECPGGGMGCLEYYIGKVGLMEDYKKKAELSESVEPKIIHERAIGGDRAAQDAFGLYGHRLGIACASSANLLDLGVIILTGGILGAWDYFEAELSRSFRKNLITPHKEFLQVKKTTLHGNAGILGAAFLDKVD